MWFLRDIFVAHVFNFKLFTFALAAQMPLRWSCFCCTCWFGFPNLHDLPSWQIGHKKHHRHVGEACLTYGKLKRTNCKSHVFWTKSGTFRELILASATLKLTRMNSWLPGHNFLINTVQSQMLEVIVKIDRIRVHLAVSTYRNALIQPCQGY